MARNTKDPVQQYRGSTLQHNNYTGPAGEITVDITKKTAVVHDGATVGGHPLAKEAVKIIAGESITVTGGTLAGDNTIAAKVGSTAQRGVLQVGENLQVSNGTVSSLAWTGELAELTEVTGAALGAKLNDTALVHVADENADILGRAVGEIVHSLVPIKCAGLHLLDGSNLASQGLYSAFYQYMLKIHDSGDYPDLFVTETEWQQSVTNYGVCGKFVLDTTGGTIRIPKVTGHIEGTIDAATIGDLIEAGLPNIEGTFGNLRGDNSQYYTASGSFEQTLLSTGSYNGNYNSKGILTSFDASRSNPIYGNSTTVQTQSIKGYIYMVVGTYMKLDMAVDVDEAVAVVMDANKRVELKGSRTTTGDWTITGLEVGKPLYLALDASESTSYTMFRFRIISGTKEASSVTSAVEYTLGHSHGNYMTTNVATCIPTSDTVVVNISTLSNIVGGKLNAYQ